MESYIRDRFEALGLESVGDFSFRVPVMVEGEGGARLEMGGGAQVGLNVFFGNAVTPPVADGLKGPLVWGGNGTYRAMNGRQVAGAVVLMELDSGKAWQNAAALGALAVIYLLPEDVDRFLFEDKFELTPVAFPRFFLDAARARDLFGERMARADGLLDEEVVIHADVHWEPVQGVNIYGKVPGQGGDLAPLVVSAFYDSSSFVGGKRPGSGRGPGNFQPFGLGKGHSVKTYGAAGTICGHGRPCAVFGGDA